MLNKLFSILTGKFAERGAPDAAPSIKHPWQVGKVRGDRCDNPEYKKLVQEEIAEYSSVEITKDLKLGGIHDFGAWHYYWKHVNRRVEKLLGCSNIWPLMEKNANAMERPRILSLGCGHGGHELGLARRLRTGYHITALDLNENILKTARETAAREKLNIKFECADLNYISLPEGGFDFVFSQASLHHIMNLEHLFEQINRALTDDGEFYIADIIGKNRVILWDENLKYLNGLVREIPERFRRDERGRLVKKISPSKGEGMEGVRQEELYGILLEHMKAKFVYPHNAFIRFIATHPVLGRNLSEDTAEARGILDYLIGEDDRSVESKALRPTEFLGIFGRE
ncbi:MAG: class I SAM-dependent methyltransferase [Deltaproteobacteria bacterium]|nr:class I SAM-dependent methyltransferase [Deltaproteobacteria bacterium]MBZ0219966.1 class I SAM-dependent methyltransferase [Deltaproteobacteria bacterium]